MIQDGLGSVRSVIDSAEILESRLYEPYGGVFGTSGTVQTGYGFTGEQYDASTDLLYLRARHYKPGLGQFTALDPFEGMAQRPMSLNGYSWVEGRVVDGSDPSGRVYISPNPDMWASCSNYLQITCANPINLVGQPSNSSNIDRSYATYNSNLASIIDLVWIPLKTYLRDAARRAMEAGNIHAADNLWHWLEGNGQPITNYNVDQMIVDLPIFQLDIGCINNNMYFTSSIIGSSCLLGSKFYAKLII